MIGGSVASGFEPVSVAFAENFQRRGDRGAAFAAVIDGQLVVDLWGGDAGAGRPWNEDTVVPIFSATKALVALCVLMLADRGELDVERPVSDYWPEFARHGKESVSVAQALSHRGRVPGIHEPLVDEDLFDPVAMAARVAAQPLETDSRAAFVYHAMTFGWIGAELIRRVDGRSAGRFFADEVAAPLSLELWIGLPALLEQRTATLALASDWGSSRISDPALDNGDDPLFRSIWANPPLFVGMPWNRAARHQAEIPGAGGIGNARSIARLYGCLACGGELDGYRLLREETLSGARRELVRAYEPLLEKEMVYGLGFQLQTPQHHLGPPDVAFGHDGAGGGMHGAWPEERVGFSYAMNELRDTDEPDPRNAALLDALYRSVRRRADGLASNRKGAVT